MTEAEIINRSADEVLHVVQRHCARLRSLEEGGDVQLDQCRLLDCPHRQRYRQTLVETVEVLEQTKKSFKSKQLERLRQKLIRVLAEDD